MIDAPMRIGQWLQSLDHDEPCQLIEVSHVWGQTTCLIWLPRRATAIRVPQARLAPLRAVNEGLLDHLCFLAAASRIVEGLEQDVLVAPIEGGVIPLPHQLQALQRAVSGDRVRYLLADEVGLGK